MEEGGGTGKWCGSLSAIIHVQGCSRSSLIPSAEMARGGVNLIQVDYHNVSPYYRNNIS